MSKPRIFYVAENVVDPDRGHEIVDQDGNRISAAMTDDEFQIRSSINCSTGIPESEIKYEIDQEKYEAACNIGSQKVKKFAFLLGGDGVEIVIEASDLSAACDELAKRLKAQEPDVWVGYDGEKIEDEIDRGVFQVREV